MDQAACRAGRGSNPFRDASRALPHNLIVAKLPNYVRHEFDIAARAMAHLAQSGKLRLFMVRASTA